MDKHFNTAGPGKPAPDYLIDPLTRIDLAEIESLIEQQRYFELVGPPQSGKTSGLLAVRDHLNQQGRYAVIYVSAIAIADAGGGIDDGQQPAGAGAAGVTC